MIEKIKPVYYCQFCKKHSLAKHSMKIHEQRCHLNPDNYRSCFSCKNITKEDYIVCDDNGYCADRTIKIFYCKSTKNYLHPPITEHKKNYLGDTMPMCKSINECDKFIDIMF